MLLFAVFANLVANGARSLASGLAGSRALAAATGTQSFVQHCFINSFDVFTHNDYLQKNILLLVLFYLVFAYFARIFLNCSFTNTISRPIFFHCIICFYYSLFIRFYPYNTSQKIIQHTDKNNLMLFSAICYPTSIMYSHAFIVKFHRIC